MLNSNELFPRLPIKKVINCRENLRKTGLRILMPVTILFSASACSVPLSQAIEPTPANIPRATPVATIETPTFIKIEIPTRVVSTQTKTVALEIATETKIVFPTATGTSTPTETPKPTEIPILKIINGRVDWPRNNLELDKFAEQKGTAIVPFVEPGDFIGQVGQNKYAGDFILKKDGTIIFIPRAVFSEYFRIKSARSQVFSSDGTLYFEASNETDSRGKRISEIRRSAVISPYGTGQYIVAARCDIPNCWFDHPPAVDLMGLYGVAIKNTEYESFLQLFEVFPHHHDTLYQAPAGWVIDRVNWGSGLEENSVFMEMFHTGQWNNWAQENIDFRGFFRLKDAAEHNHFPSFIRDLCPPDDPSKHRNQADHCMMEYNKYNTALGKYELRPADKLPKLEMLFGGSMEDNMPFNLIPIEKPSSSDKREYTIKVTK